MNLTEKTLKSDYIHKGRIINLREDTIELPNGGTAFREVVEHNGGVSVVAVNDRNEIHFVRQFRYPYNEIITELPAGKLNLGEDPLECAKRELQEETGAIAEQYSFLGKVYPTPGYCAEILYIYLATGIKTGQSNPDEDEFLESFTLPFEEAYEKALNGEFLDAKTVIGILRAKYFMEKSNI